MEDFTLKIFKIKSRDEVCEFKSAINSIDPSNPFYKPELILEAGEQHHDIHYFVYYEKGEPKVLMSFYLRPIFINEESTGYRDTCSPYGYSGPLFNPTSTGLESLKHFWEMVDDWYKENNVVSEFIRFSLNDNHIGYTGFAIPTLNNVCGKIIDAEQQWIDFKPKVRNNFRKAEKENLTFKMFFEDIPENVISDFYGIYISTMKRNKATDMYYFSQSYFSKYLKENPKNAGIAMVYCDGTAISTEFVLLSDNTIFSYLGGTDSAYFHTRPNDFLKINVLEWGRNVGKKHYVLGGGRTNGDQLYKYKKNFFPKEDDIVYLTGRKIILPEIYRSLSKKVLQEREIDIESSLGGHGYFPAYRMK